MTSERLAEIKHNLEHAGRTHYRDVSDLLADNAALREAVGLLGAECCWWQASEHLRKNEPHNEFARLADARAATRANPLAAAAVREAKEQA